MGKRCAYFGLSLLFLVTQSQAFRCFSEYEYTWWDGAGIKHVNAFSMSHFQLKAKSAFIEKRTHRYPIKESYFIVRLHPTYRESLLNDCPHAMIIAHLIVSIVDPVLSSAVSHYQTAVKIFNEAESIHREVTFYAWPLTQALSLAENTIHKRAGERAVTGNVTMLVSSEMLDTVAQIVPTFKGRFHSFRIVTPDQAMLRSFESHEGLTVQHYPKNSSQPECIWTVSVLKELTLENFPVIVLFDKSDFLSPLLEQILNLAASSRDEIPSYISLGMKRTMPRFIEGSFLAMGTYASPNFVIGNQALVREHIETMSAYCKLAGYDNLWHQLSLESPMGFHTPLRCDDEKLPITLRLCLGDEHTRTDWRNTFLAPVVARHPVKPY